MLVVITVFPLSGRITAAVVIRKAKGEEGEYKKKEKKTKVQTTTISENTRTVWYYIFYTAVLTVSDRVILKIRVRDS